MNPPNGIEVEPGSVWARGVSGWLVAASLLKNVERCIPPSSPSICWITVGGIGQKREIVDGQIATRKYLSLTVSFDHNMMDAAPGARFTERFKELMESGDGLTPDEAAIAEPIGSQRVLERA